MAISFCFGCIMPLYLFNYVFAVVVFVLDLCFVTMHVVVCYISYFYLYIIDMYRQGSKYTKAFRNKLALFCVCKKNVQTSQNIYAWKLICF